MNIHLRLAAATALALASWVAQAGTPTIVYYDIAGSTPNDLRRDLDAKGPLGVDGERYDALTEWSVAWAYRYMPVDQGCEMVEVTVTVDGVITMPRWDGAEGQGRLGERWQRYLASLRMHENGHYAHAVMAAADVRSLGQSFRVSGDCSGIAGEFNRMAADILERYSSADVAYDRQTDHGRTQGARFP